MNYWVTLLNRRYIDAWKRKRASLETHKCSGGRLIVLSLYYAPIIDFGGKLFKQFLIIVERLFKVKGSHKIQTFIAYQIGMSTQKLNKINYLC